MEWGWVPYNTEGTMDCLGCGIFTSIGVQGISTGNKIPFTSCIIFLPCLFFFSSRSMQMFSKIHIETLGKDLLQFALTKVGV